MKRIFLFLVFISLASHSLISQEVRYKWGDGIYKGKEWLSVREYENLIQQDSNALFYFEKYQITKAPIVFCAVAGGILTTYGAIRLITADYYDNKTFHYVSLYTGIGFCVSVIVFEISSTALLKKSIRVYNKRFHRNMFIESHVSASQVGVVLHF